MRKFVSLIFFASVFLAVWIHRKAPDPAIATSSPDVREISPPPTARAGLLTTAVSSTNSPSSGTVSALAPSVDEMRAEVVKNPHVAPPSLIAFSTALAPRLDEAMKSPAKAEEFYSELRECVEGPTQKGAPTIRALCLINLRRLGKSPALRERVETVWNRADPEIRRLAQ